MPILVQSIQFKKLPRCLALALVLLADQAGAGSLSLQYGSNFEDQEQMFVDTELAVFELGYINLGVGASNYQYNNTTTVTTDYYSVGYFSPGDKDVVVGLGYDYWERGKLQTDSWRADLYLYKGDWQIGLHPEWHYITFTASNGTTLEFKNAGGGLSLGYFVSDNLYIYGDYYRYQFEVPSWILSRFRALPLRVRIGLRLLASDMSSEIDDRRATLGANYYFDTVSIGIERQQITSAIDGSEYDITSINTSWMLNTHWQTGLRISAVSGAENKFYSFSLSYDWY